jgi:hypothetical protein
MVVIWPKALGAFWMMDPLTSADDARPDPRQCDLVRHLPIGHAERGGALLGQRRNLLEEVPGGRGNDGDDHQAEHEPDRQQTLPRRRWGAPEEVQHRHIGHVLADERIDVARQNRSEGQ